MSDREALDEIRFQIAKQEALVARMREAVEQAEADCSHEWRNTCQPVETMEPTIDWDHPICNGSHHTFGTKYVPVTKTAHVRECQKCGKIEKTFRTSDMITQEPAFT